MMLVEQYNAMHKENTHIDIERYFNTKTLRRLRGKGLFCGMDYVGIEALRPIAFYSRLDHSMNVAYTASKLSDELEEVLAGAFHDVGTLSFSHVNSFKKRNGLKQDNDERNIKSILLEDEEVLTYLSEDGINIDDVVDYSRYPLIDKEIPCMCLDRVEGVLATCLFWAHTHTLDDIRGLYNMLCYIDKLDGLVFPIDNPRFKDFRGEMFLNEHFGDLDYEDFFEAINVYSKKLLTKEDRYMMEILGCVLRYYEDVGVFDEDDLFYLSEEEIINRILESPYKDIWRDVMSIDKVFYDDAYMHDLSFIVKPKIRQVNPLCMGQMCLGEINDISGNFYRELNDLKESIALLERPIAANLCDSTIKILRKYK